MNGLFQCWCAFCFVIILLCQPNTGQDVITPEPCGDDGVLEVVNNTASQILTVRDSDMMQLGLGPILHLFWSLRLVGRTIILGDCFLRYPSYRGGFCNTKYRDIFKMETITSNRSTSSAVVLTISTTSNSYNLSDGYFDSGSALFGNSTVLVEDRYNETPILNCSTDFVELAESVECTMVFIASTIPRSIRSRCDVTKVFSARGRYKCQLYVTQSTGQPKALGSPTPMTIAAAENGYHVNGSCTMTAAELETADVKDSYTVEITPGKKKYIVKWKLSRPSHTCPASVTEGSNVRCRCELSDVGHPPATVHWQQTGSASLALTSLSRHDNGSVFTCLMVWNGSEVDSVNYSLNIQRRPTSPKLSHNCPAYVTQGSTLDCSCFTSDAGFPPATLTWSDMTSQPQRLLRHNVQRDADGTVLTCLMAWRGINLTAINYTLIVAPDCSATYASGVGLGLGVGVVLMTVVVVIVQAMVFWRKGWVVELPCADRNKTDRCDVFPAKQSGFERRLPEPEVELRAGNQISMWGSAVNYEILDVSNIGLSSQYESLGKSSEKTSNVRKKRLKRKGPKSQVTEVPPTQSNSKEIATEVYANVS